MFEPTSRYAAIENATLTATDAAGSERIVAYKRRRFVPSAAGMTVLVEHTFVQGDRLDTVTARYVGDPTQFWRVCDANSVLDPAELDEIGRSIRIALPGS